MTGDILQVDGLRKVFRGRGSHLGQHVAVDDVSFTVAQGSCLAIVGESGSGKTTTARIIAGLEQADAGTITLAGNARDVRDRSRRHRDTGVQMVFQDPLGSLDRRQRIGDGLAELLSLGRRTPAGARRDRVAELLTQVGLDERHAAELPRSLSGGQRQRVAVARALAMRPSLLILDEPTSALDVSVQAQVLNVLSRLRRDTGISYLFVTHNLAVVRQVSDRCLVMREGRVVEHGPTDDVLSRPQQQYTQRLIASIPRPGWRPVRAQTVPEAIR
ncbi:ABC transporter ATP-binding protein [Actinoplanes sp. NPDC000266]